MTKKIILSIIILLALASCKKEVTNRPTPPPPKVQVTLAQMESIKETQSFIGQTRPNQDVELMTKVEGYIKSVGFKDGGPVKKDELLFEIDKEPYEVKVKQAKAKVDQAKATKDEAEKNFSRMETLFKKQTVSEKDKDSAEASFKAAEASLSAAAAELAYAKLNLKYTEIKAPFDGKMAIGHTSIGNYISPQSGAIAQIVSLQPMYVDVNISEKLLITVLQKNLQEGESLLDIKKDQEWNFSLKLSNGETYDHEGKVDSFDNKVNASTGTVKVRFKFPNPDFLLSPNQYVQLLLTKKKPDSKLVIPQSALMSDQTGEYVYTLNDQNIVQRRSVLTEARVEDKAILATSPEKGLFLKEGERVIYQGTQKARPGKEATALQTPSITDKEQ